MNYLILGKKPEVFMAERHYSKETFIIRTHAYSAHEVMIHSH